MSLTDAELFARQDALQSEARAVMVDLDLLALLGRSGTPVHTGSSALGLMVRRDIDGRPPVRSSMLKLPRLARAL
jgi:hypothetical protein